jgi:hypothetical protein
MKDGLENESRKAKNGRIVQSEQWYYFRLSFFVFRFAK